MITHTILISSGTGPIEARAFTAQLAARIVDRCRAEAIDIVGEVVHGPAHAPRSVALDVRGTLEPGLAGEWGTHVLIARSAQRSRRARKRWYAAVSVGRPRSDGAVASIDARDLVIQACRSGGPGGQHVNKASTAVRVLHRPSGIAVRVSAQRSQHSNRRVAVARIAAELASRQERAVADARARRRAQHHKLERGAPVRVYRLDQHQRLEEIHAI